MAIMVKRTKLFFDGGKDEAPVGSTFEFDITEHPAFKCNWEHLLSAEHQMRVAQFLVYAWNRSQPKNWKYELV